MVKRGDGKGMDADQIRRMAERMAADAPRCEECGKWAVSHFYPGFGRPRWLCEAHFRLVFFVNFGRWPGEE